jgi:hypothetical protein
LVSSATSSSFDGPDGVGAGVAVFDFETAFEFVFELAAGGGLQAANKAVSKAATAAAVKIIDILFIKLLLEIFFISKQAV